MSDLSRYDADPDACAWARGYAEKLAAKYREFEQRQKADGDLEKAAMWRKFANLLEMELVGGKTCVITPFDERRAKIVRLMQESSPVPEPDKGGLKDA